MTTPETSPTSGRTSLTCVERGAVDDDELELALELVEHARHAAALEQLERRSAGSGRWAAASAARLAGLRVDADRAP